jgi:hypothetical protein
VTARLELLPERDVRLNVAPGADGGDHEMHETILYCGRRGAGARVPLTAGAP